jgi:hypothetical protein
MEQEVEMKKELINDRQRLVAVRGMLMEVERQRDALQKALITAEADLTATYNAIASKGGPIVSLGQFQRLGEIRKLIEQVRA